MIRVHLLRFCWSPIGTYGALTLPSGLRIWTAERPWLDNAPRVSCIPPGLYVCEPRRYNRGGYQAIGLRDVPGRTSILLHRGNTPADVEGCIVVGLSLGSLPDTRGRHVWAVKGSAEAWTPLMEELGGRTFELEIGPAMPVELRALVRGELGP